MSTGVRSLAKAPFSELLELDEELRKSDPNLPDFPPKSFWKRMVSPSFMDARQAALSEYLSTVVRQDSTLKQPQLRTLLNAGIGVSPCSAYDVTESSVGLAWRSRATPHFSKRMFTDWLPCSVQVGCAPSSREVSCQTDIDDDRRATPCHCDPRLQVMEALLKQQLIETVALHAKLEVLQRRNAEDLAASVRSIEAMVSRLGQETSAGTLAAVKESIVSPLMEQL